MYVCMYVCIMCVYVYVYMMTFRSTIQPHTNSNNGNTASGYILEKCWPSCTGAMCLKAYKHL